jgi:histidyl-tRNA synthetase
MKYADKIKAKYAILIGDDEINFDKLIAKNMQSGENIEIPAPNAKKIMEALAI